MNRLCAGDTTSNKTGLCLTFSKYSVETERGLPAGAGCEASRQPAGTGVQMHLLELETAGHFMWYMKLKFPRKDRQGQKSFRGFRFS